MYNLRKVQLIERGIWANAPFTPERNRGTRGMQMLVIYGVLTWALLGGALWLSGCSLFG